MHLTRYFLERPLVSWAIIWFLIVGGIYAFFTLSKVADPEFTLRRAVIYTPFPGANPSEVEAKVSAPLEHALSQVKDVEQVISTSSQGMSEITVIIKDKFNQRALENAWTQVRYTVWDTHAKLTNGILPSVINDELDDVYGIYYVLVGDEASDFSALENYAKILQHQLMRQENIAKVKVTGEQKQHVYIDINAKKLKHFNVSLNEIEARLKDQADIEYLSMKSHHHVHRVEFDAITDALDSLPHTFIKNTASGKSIFLGDLATIKKTRIEGPDLMVRYNGKPALTLAIALADRSRALSVDKLIQAEFQQLAKEKPRGVELIELYHQASYVQEIVSNYFFILLFAFLMTFIFIYLTHGKVKGHLINTMIIINMLAAFLVMRLLDLDLQRISVGAIVISLGIIVDNAIMLVSSLANSRDRHESAEEIVSGVVKRYIKPIIAACIVAVAVYIPFGFTDYHAINFFSSLYLILCITLVLSILIRLCIAPFLFVKYFDYVPLEVNNSHRSEIIYKKLLKKTFQYKWYVLVVAILVYLASVYGSTYFKQVFYLKAEHPLFYVNYWQDRSFGIQKTNNDIQAIEKYVLKQPEVQSVTSFVGQGSTKFLKNYERPPVDPSFGQLLIHLNSLDELELVAERIHHHIEKTFPSAIVALDTPSYGPGDAGSVEVRFLGDDPLVLRQLADGAKRLLFQTGHATNIKDDWREQVTVLKPTFSEKEARKHGVNVQELTRTLQAHFTGRQLGVYKDGKDLLPIILRSPVEDKTDIETLKSLPIWSQALGRNIPISEIIASIETVKEEQSIHRRDRQRAITVSAKTFNSTAISLTRELQEQISELDIPPGYEVDWGGEYRDQLDAEYAMNAYVPLSWFFIVVAFILLFNQFKELLMLLYTIIIISLVCNFVIYFSAMHWNMMSMIGYMTLLLITVKQVIIFNAETDHLLQQSQHRNIDLIIESASKRLKPVFFSVCAICLCVLPLWYDIIFHNFVLILVPGLIIASILLLVFSPLLYVLHSHYHLEK